MLILGEIRFLGENLGPLYSSSPRKLISPQLHYKKTVEILLTVKKRPKISCDPLWNFLDTNKSKVANYNEKWYVHTPGAPAHACGESVLKHSHNPMKMA